MMALRCISDYQRLLLETVLRTYDPPLPISDIVGYFEDFNPDFRNKQTLVDFITSGGNAYYNHLLWCLRQEVPKYPTDDATPVNTPHSYLAFRLMKHHVTLFYRWVWLCVDEDGCGIQKKAGRWYLTEQECREVAMGEVNLELPYAGKMLLFVETSCICQLSLDDDLVNEGRKRCVCVGLANVTRDYCKGLNADRHCYCYLCSPVWHGSTVDNKNRLEYCRQWGHANDENFLLFTTALDDEQSDNRNTPVSCTDGSNDDVAGSV